MCSGRGKMLSLVRPISESSNDDPFHRQGDFDAVSDQKSSIPLSGVVHLVVGSATSVGGVTAVKGRPHPSV